jgi:hypothetical protein
MRKDPGAQVTPALKSSQVDQQDAQPCSTSTCGSGLYPMPDTVIISTQMHHIQ